MPRNGSRSRTYTPEIIATPCRTCGKQPPERCRPKDGGLMAARYDYPPHKARVEDALKSKEIASE